MAFSVNKVVLLGRLGGDMEIRETPTSSIGSFNLATTHSYKGKDGQFNETTDWHSVTLFNPGDWHRQLLKKGNSVFIEGRISYSTSEGKDGSVRYFTNIIALDIVPASTYGRAENSNSKPKASVKPSAPEPQIPEDDLPF